MAAGADATGFDPIPVSIKAIGGGVPVGTVIAWPVAGNPEDYENWLECNGQSTAGYPDLAAVIGANVPNYQGMFLRGYGSQNHSKNNGSTVGVTVTTHSSGALGQVQGDTTRNIIATVIATQKYSRESASTGPFYHGVVAYTPRGGYAWKGTEGWNEGEIEFDLSRSVPTAPENRPVNMAVRYLIRAKP